MKVMNREWRPISQRICLGVLLVALVSPLAWAQDREEGREQLVFEVHSTQTHEEDSLRMLAAERCVQLVKPVMVSGIRDLGNDGPMGASEVSADFKCLETTYLVFGMGGHREDDSTSAIDSLWQNANGLCASMVEPLRLSEITGIHIDGVYAISAKFTCRLKASGN